MNSTANGTSPLFHRLVFALLIPIFLGSFYPLRLIAANEGSNTVLKRETRSVEKAKINMTAPPVNPAIPLSFSDEPGDGEFVKVRLFAEPLLPMGSQTSVTENKALAEAILAFGNNPTPDEMEPLEAFLKEYPESAWRVSLLTNMGIIYRSGGYWMEAFVAWQKAWEFGKQETDPTRRLIVDRALAQATDLALKISWTDYLKMFLEEAKVRDMRGPTSEMMANARSGLYLMQKDETKTGRCGPLAVRRILAPLDPVKAASTDLKEPVPNELGTTFVQLKEFSKELGLDYQIAFRSPGAQIIVPCVVNWKVGHHAALTRELNGRYVVEDVTFGQKFVISEKAIDRESSGYFLVPKGKMPIGWRVVDKTEGAKVWGKGWVEPTTPPPPPDPNDDKNCKTRGMAGYSVDFSRVNLKLSDTPLFYSPSHGPSIEFTVNYSQRDVAFSAVPNYPNLGSKWNFGWVCFIIDDPSNQNTQSYGPGGGQLSYTGFSGDRFSLEPHTRSVLIRTSGTSYLRTFPDGSRQVFGLADNSLPKRIFMTESYDPAGNKIAYNYDPTTFRLLSVTDSLGMETTLSYLSNDSANPGFYRVKEVADPFGRKAILEYYPFSNPSNSGLLKKITDMGGISSEFTYGTGDFVAKLTTPYGDTTFESNDVDKDRSLLITDPMGEKEFVEFKYSQSPPGGYDPLFNGYEEYRNSYFWDKKAYASAPGDYSAAKLMHWLHTYDWQAMSDVLESEKAPKERGVHYSYPGQFSPLGSGTLNQPSVVARALDDGFIQVTQYEYNSFGKPTKVVTPGNATTPSRTTTYQYAANDIDPLAVYQQNPAGQSIDSYGVAADLLQSFTYDEDGKHLVMSKTDASGQTTHFTYNGYGQILTVTNAKGETTAITYDRDQDNDGLTDGYPLQVTVTGQVNGVNKSDTTSFEYDGFKRLHKVTDSQGYAVQTDYEAIGGDPTKTLNRPTKITYPDMTTSEVTYNRLDAEWTKDRLGRWTHTLFNNNRQPEIVTDPLGQTTQYAWCACGALESITDPAGNQTTFVRDVQGRVTAKVFPDNQSLIYHYENSTSRLASVHDAKGQETHYQYNIDNSLRQVSYTDAAGNDLTPPTPSVSYTYDTVYPRILTMTDGIGLTQNVYNPVTAPATLGAGQLATVSGPWADATISYSYDELGRGKTRSINGDVNTVTFDYDGLGRVGSMTNPLGAFGFTYVETTGRLNTVSYPNGQSTTFGYFDNTHDKRLQEIKHLNPSGGVMSQFDYTYNVVGNILTWTQANAAAINARNYTFGYDAADQLKSAQLKEETTQAVLKDLVYDYALAGNRMLVQESGVASIETPNELNQITRKSGAGRMRFAGSLSKPARVTVGGNPATVHADKSFEGYAMVGTGSASRVHIVATDANGNTNDKYVDVPISAQPPKTYLYDANGNMTAAGPTGAPDVTYGWDAANRLTSIVKSRTTTLFDYDGLGRRMREWTNGVETKRWVWVGLELCEERDSNNAVTKRFYPQGEQIAGANYYYTRDHLGSVREMTDANGAVQARYDYDPYGKRTKVSGNLEADFGFTGHYQHIATGLTLAPYRAYDADLGRWISRDPLGDPSMSLMPNMQGMPQNVRAALSSGRPVEMLQGPNLYEYVGNDPVLLTDPLGLWQASAIYGAGYGFSATLGYNGGQWNFGFKFGFGLGSSLSFDPSCNRKKEGFGLAAEAEASAGEGYGGAGLDGNLDSNQGNSLTGNWRGGPFGFSHDFGSGATGFSGLTNYGGSVFVGGGFSWAGK